MLSATHKKLKKRLQIVVHRGRWGIGNLQSRGSGSGSWNVTADKTSIPVESKAENVRLNRTMTIMNHDDDEQESDEYGNGFNEWRMRMMQRKGIMCVCASNLPLAMGDDDNDAIGSTTRRTKGKYSSGLTGGIFEREVAAAVTIHEGDNRSNERKE